MTRPDHDAAHILRAALMETSARLVDMQEGIGRSLATAARVQAEAALREPDPSPASRPEGAATIEVVVETFAETLWPGSWGEMGLEVRVLHIRAMQIALAAYDATHPKSAAPAVSGVTDFGSEFEPAADFATNVATEVCNQLRGLDWCAKDDGERLDRIHGEVQDAIARLLPTTLPPGPAQGSDGGGL